MTHTKIPQMSQTRIPGHKRAMSSPPGSATKRLHILEDVTNTNSIARLPGTKMSVAVDSNTRLMNKYYYGDPKVIEAVKVRERKIARDIQHFRKSIAEIDAETKLIQETNLPNLDYDMSKKNTLCNELRKELIQLTASLDEKNGECELMESNWELTVKHLQLEHEVNLQKARNEIDQALCEARERWEEKLREMENFRPDSGIIEEIEELKEERLQEEKKLNALEASNKRACTMRDQELDIEFQKFLLEKQKPSEELREKCQVQREKNKQLTEEILCFENQLEESTRDCARLYEAITGIEKLIKACLEEREELLERRTKVEASFRETELTTQKVQTEASAVESKYNAQFDKMEKEQLRRRKMENSIDEMRAKVRCFAYIGDKVPPSCEIDYPAKKISMIGPNSGQSSVFSRIIPRKLIPEKDLIGQECQAYLDMCTAKGLNCNIISLPTDRQQHLRECFLQYFVNSNTHKLRVQYVALSEKMPSSDLLVDPEDSRGDELQLTIKEDAIEMSSRSVELESPQDITDAFSGLELHSRVGDISVMKLKVYNKSEDYFDAYFLEINDDQTIKNISNLSNKNRFVKTPITIILQTLLLKTKSLILCNLFDGRTSDPCLVLESVHQIGRLDVPRKLNER